MSQQCSNAVFRWKSWLRIVSCNITFILFTSLTRQIRLTGILILSELLLTLSFIARKFQGRKTYNANLVAADSPFLLLIRGGLSTWRKSFLTNGADLTFRRIKPQISVESATQLRNFSPRIQKSLVASKFIILLRTWFFQSAYRPLQTIFKVFTNSTTFPPPQRVWFFHCFVWKRV